MRTLLGGLLAVLALAVGIGSCGTKAHTGGADTLAEPPEVTEVIAGDGLPNPDAPRVTDLGPEEVDAKSETPRVTDVVPGDADAKADAPDGDPMHADEPGADACQPNCAGKECGDDGCGGECGQCPANSECEVGACVVQLPCGDGTCDVATGEDCGSCPGDCGWCSVCGDGDCTAGEDCVSCGQDCGQCPDCEGCGLLEECHEQLGVCVPKTVVVPQGAFWMGCNDWPGAAQPDTDCDADEYPYHQVLLKTYRIDVTEVTVSQFAAFMTSLALLGKDNECFCSGMTEDCVNVNALSLPIEKHDGGWEPDLDQSTPQDPMVMVSWCGASAYCQWIGRRLCTEAEWEKAGRGGCEWYSAQAGDCQADSYVFPWGNSTPGPNLAVACDACEGGPCPVGSVPSGASPYGVLDMAGNASEWVADWYAGDYYCNGPEATCPYPCFDCIEQPPYLGGSEWSDPLGPPAGSARAVRGEGSFDPCHVEFLRLSNRSLDEDQNPSWFLGFRCCKSGQ